MTRNNLIFGGVNSADYNVWISGSEAFGAPERSVERVSVPGRNGDLIIDNGKWNNITIDYPAFIPKGFNPQFDYFRSEIMKLKGYHRLEDSYHPDEYRMATLVGGISPKKVGAFFRNGDFTLTFNCKPQRFLKIGDDPIQIFQPRMKSTDVCTNYVPVNSDDLDLAFDVSCGEGISPTIVINTYDSSLTQLSTQSFNAYNGYSNTATFTASDKFWDLTITNVSVYDYPSVRIRTVSVISGEPFPINAVLSGKVLISNPTGYSAKPLFEYYDNRIVSVELTNKDTSGNMTERYWFLSDDLSVSHFYLDCDMQYMYDTSLNNLTEDLTINTAVSHTGRSMVFPELGENIEMRFVQFDSQDKDDGIGLMLLYPRWWKL